MLLLALTVYSYLVQGQVAAPDSSMSMDAWFMVASISVGWIVSMVVMAFTIGRRVQRLEDNDNQLSSAVAELAKVVNGHSGNAVLERTLDSVMANIATLTQQSAANAANLQLHEVRLARIDAMRDAITNLVQDFYSRKWDPLVQDNARLKSEVSTALSRIESIIKELKRE